MLKLTPNCHFWGELGKNRGILKRMKKAILPCLHALATFHDEILIFDKIREHLSIRASEGPLIRKSIRFEVEMIEQSTLHRIHLI